MSLNGLRIGGQCPSPPPTFRDKLIAIGSCALVAWLAFFLAIYFEAIPIVALILFGLAFTITASIGGII